METSSSEIRKVHCSNHLLTGCTEYIEKRGVILCQKCIDFKKSMMKDLNDQNYDEIKLQLLSKISDYEDLVKSLRMEAEQLRKENIEIFAKYEQSKIDFEQLSLELERLKEQNGKFSNLQTSLEEEKTRLDSKIKFLLTEKTRLEGDNTDLFSENASLKKDLKNKNGKRS
jgi:chromosome segregation ATPase